MSFPRKWNARSPNTTTSPSVVIGLADPNGDAGYTPWSSSPTPAPLTEREVVAYAKTRLAAYKGPKTVEFVAEIPRTAATKVNRSAMVEARGG